MIYIIRGEHAIHYTCRDLGIEYCIGFSVGKKYHILGKSFYLSQTINIAVFIYVSIELSIIKVSLSVFRGGCHGRDRTVVGFTTTYGISAYHH